MLSSDVATTLGGRYITKHIMPYSFSEFLNANEISYDTDTIATTSGRAKVQRYFESYFHFGGFPEGAKLASKRDYINSVYQKIYLGDIASRNKIENLYSSYQTFQGIGLQASHNPNLRVRRRNYCKRQENRSDTCMEMVT